MTIASVLGSSNKVPGAYIQVSLGVGRRSGASAVDVLILGNKTSAGDATVDTEVRPIYSPDDADAFWGPGSEGALMARATFEVNRNATMNGVAVTESAGTAATKALVFTGTATASGVVEVWVAGHRVVAEVAVGDTASVVGDSVEAAINANAQLPATAANVTGTVTLTAKQKGPRGNYITCRSLKTNAAGISHTAASGTFASGATEDDYTAALSTISPTRYRFIAVATDDTTNLGLVKAQVDSQALPETGIRQRFFYGSQDSLANTVTLSDAVNAKRGQLVWAAASDDLPSEMASALAGLVSREVDKDPSANLDGLTLTGLRPAYDPADKPLTTELISALNNGITPLDSGSGEVFVVRSITNYSTDGSSLPDFSVYDTSKVDVPDTIADQIQARFNTEFAQFKLAPDPEEGEAAARLVAHPSLVRDWFFGILKDAEAAGWLTNVDALKDEVLAEIDGVVDGRMNGVLPADVIEGFHQLGADVRQIG